MRSITFICLLITAISLAGCSTSIDGQRYVGQQPDFDLFDFFQGDIKAWGIVQDRSGNLVQRFDVDIIGRLENDRLILDEKFHFHIGDGPTERIWNVERLSEDSYQGTASDIVGTASGTAYGNAIQWNYEMDLPVGDRHYRVTFDDWIWAFDSERILNRSYIKKFGLVMAEVTIFMEKQ